MDKIDYWLLTLISLFGAATLFMVFWKMKGGFGPYNLRAVGLVLIATLASLLAVKDPSALMAAIGLLGAFAGYLFGINATDRQ